jgi:tetratricopeptide (TPR) repeat protein
LFEFAEAGVGPDPALGRSLVFLAICRTLVFMTSLLLLATLLSTQPPAAAPSQDAAADLARQAQQKSREGKLDEALALYRQAIQIAPESPQVNQAYGVALDIAGQYAEARKHLAKAIANAPAPPAKAMALRMMAMSHAFERDCKAAIPYASQAYDVYLSQQDYYNAGEAANEVARVCIDSGNLDEAAAWYQKGHDIGLQEPAITAERKDLWAFRLEHAKARIAARRGNKAEAQQHVAAARAILDRGVIDSDQAQYYPYLVGYVALYTGDYQTALNELQKTNQRDPFFLCLIAETYEKMGRKDDALEYYRKALALANGHNPPNAYARPLAQQKLK